MAQRSTAARTQRKPRSPNPERGRRTNQAPLMAGVPSMVEQRIPSGRQRKRNPSMSISPPAGGREKKRAEIRIEGGAQVLLIPAGMVGILKGGVTEAEVGVRISPIGIKSIGTPGGIPRSTPGSGSPSMPVTVDITEACAN
ncbi:hypothetical protein LEMLEM_LOCUS17456 [Lemmus lemmus]